MFVAGRIKSMVIIKVYYHSESLYNLTYINARTRTRKDKQTPNAKYGSVVGGHIPYMLLSSVSQEKVRGEVV